jgi:Fe-S cluster biogenesis protein NfuA
MTNIVDVQTTPNPDAIKFITDTRLVERGAASFETPSAAQGNPLAEALFASGPVASVFILDRFVTVTKISGAEWGDLEMKLRVAIETHAQPVAPASGADSATVPDMDLLARVEAAVDEHVRPALAGDGGGLEILGLQDFVVTMHYQGACGSCPSAATGTLFYIQDLLQRTVDPRLQVVSV